jgi:hypothetical protein
MHDLKIIKRLNQDAQDKFDGKEVIPVKPNLAKKTASRKAFFEKRASITENPEHFTYATEGHKICPICGEPVT